MPLDTQYEDQTRYTAPPDSQPDELQYTPAQIRAYLESWIPDQESYYTIDEVTNILHEAANSIHDEELGIESLP